MSTRQASTRRLDEGPHLDSGGTGLGLALARRVARTVGGDVRLAHRPDQRWAVFVIELPRRSG